jgi:peptide methionine sulfoxide reductase msrA/msrB
MRAFVIALALFGAALALRAGTEDAASSGAPSPTSGPTALATFAGGCFWCMETPFEELPGVLDVTSGYSGGDEPNPTYGEVSSGSTGHAESIQVRYDPTRISYETLLQVFWRQIDPTDAGGQFVDRGRQYRSAIFVRTDEERRAAEASRDALAASGRFSKPIVTEIIAFRSFHPAEDYHQNYYETHPIRYKYYRHGSGRDQFLEKAWEGAPPVEIPDPRGDRWRRPSDAELRARLTEEQWRVTQDEGTEPPFRNAYWDNHADGIYALQLTRQVRQRNGMAELHAADRRRQRRRAE